MRIFALFSIIGILSGCASQPPNPWESIEVPTDTPAQPIELGKFPLPSQSDSRGILYDIEGTNALEVYRLKAEGNTAIAAAHAQQIESLNKAVGSLVEAGQAQRRIADMRQEILEEERRHWMFEKVGYWFAIIGIGMAFMQWQLSKYSAQVGQNESAGDSKF